MTPSTTANEITPSITSAGMTSSTTPAEMALSANKLTTQPTSEITPSNEPISQRPSGLVS